MLYSNATFFRSQHSFRLSFAVVEGKQCNASAVYCHRSLHSASSACMLKEVCNNVTECQQGEDESLCGGTRVYEHEAAFG